MGLELIVRKTVTERVEKLVRKTELKKITKNLLKDLGSENQVVSLLITDNSEIQQLNKDYRKKDKPTDVLSFPQVGDFGVDTGEIGDIVISQDKVETQAREYQVSERDEFFRLFIHGLLHLHDYEHEGVSEDEIRKMQDKEAELFSKYVE